MKQCFSIASVFVLSVMLSCHFQKTGNIVYSDILAFPEAEGFGAYTPGGRGGRVYLVTTLEDYNPETEDPIEGSFRAAVAAGDPRIVIFRVAGIIELKTRLDIVNPYITIAGQTAPGDGVCTAKYAVSCSAHDVIIRYMRFRVGEAARIEQDAFYLHNCKDVIVDHCSASWSTDEVLSLTSDGDNITVQWCMITEGLKHSYHPKGKHSNGSLIRSRHGALSFHHNLYAHNDNRNPRPASYADAPGPIFDFRNNVIYDWGNGAGYAGKYFQRTRINYVGNYLKPGPSTSRGARKVAFSPNDSFTKMYVRNNFLEGYSAANTDNWLMIRGSGELLESVKVDKPYPVPLMQSETAVSAYDRIVANVGATKPVRDTVDLRIIANLTGGKGRIIDSPDEVGGYPDYKPGPVPDDSDQDGMPDEWELRYNLDSREACDNKLDRDSDGYTNVEEYLNGTNPLVSEEIDHHFTQYAALMKQIKKDNVQAIETAKMANAARLEREAKRRLPEIKSVISSAPDGSERKIALQIDNENTIQFVLIPSGSFMMGSPESEEGHQDDELLHSVTISRSFYMSTTTITFEQFRAVLGKVVSLPDEKNLPIRISWIMASKLCKMLSAKTEYTFRLPTEAEWEYACRAGTNTPFNTGETISTDQANFDGRFTYGKDKPGIYRGGVTPVGSFTPNAWGLYDMHGNFFEWCWDAHVEYPKGSVTDPTGPLDGRGRVIRGGTYSSHPEFLRSADRYSYGIKDDFAIRLLLEVKQP